MIALSEPYSEERALELNTLLLLSGKDAAYLQWTLFHKCPRYEQHLYWKYFLGHCIKQLYGGHIG